MNLKMLKILNTHQSTYVNNKNLLRDDDKEVYKEEETRKEKKKP